MLTKNQKEKDFNKLFLTMQQNYPYFQVKQRQHGIEWLKNKEQYLKRLINTENDKQYYYELNAILSELKDDHLGLISPHSILNLKEVYDSLGLKVWSDKIEDTLADYLYWDPIIPQEKLSNIHELIKFSSETFLDGDVLYLKIPRFKMANQSCEKLQKLLLNNYTEASHVVIDLRGNWGGNTLQWSHYIIPALIQEPIFTSYIMAFKGGDLLHEYIPSGRIPAVDLLQPITNLPQGLNYPPELQAEFKSFMEMSIKINSISNEFFGRVYLLVDNEVYSAAEAFTAWSKQTGFATIVGERTKGDGIGFDPVYFQLPYSKLLITLPIAMGLSSDGRANAEWGTEPDIKCEANEALQVVLDLIQNN